MKASALTLLLLLLFFCSQLFSIKLWSFFLFWVLCLQAEPQSKHLPSLSLDWKWAKRGKLLCGDVPVCAITCARAPLPFSFCIRAWLRVKVREVSEACMRTHPMNTPLPAEGTSAFQMCLFLCSHPEQPYC